MNKQGITDVLERLRNGETKDDAAGKVASDPRFPIGDVYPNNSTGPVPRQGHHPKVTVDTSLSVEEILAERGKTHGDFTDNARVMQALKNVMADSPNWAGLTDVQREALHMIVHKIGRICSGNPNVHDHWDDIAGYAKLASERVLSNG